MLSKLKPWLLVLVVLFAANVAIFWKFYFRGLLPFPGDLLVSFFFPWNSGGFAGYDPWTTHKQFIGADAIRQIYPWKTLVVESLKNWHWPLWNPYNFSGNVLLANLQSAVLFPGNLLYAFLPTQWGWLAQIIYLLPLYGFFWYLYFRSLKLSSVASALGALVSSNIAYLATWQEILVDIQTALFLPLILLFINTNRLIYVPIFLAFSLFGGHIQTAVYIFALVFFYLLFKKVSLKWVIPLMVAPIFLAAAQLLPSFEAYQLSARETVANQALYERAILPWKELATIFAPDFFGNPATDNYHGFDYSDHQAYFGIAALVLAALALFMVKDKTARLFAFVAAGGILFATRPLAYLWPTLHLPILSSSVPSRTLFLFQIGGTVLAAFGLEYWQKTQKKPYFLLLILVVYAVLALTGDAVGRRNLILPVIVLAVTIFALVLKRLKLSLFLIFALAILEYANFYNKLHPFSPAKFFYPDHPIITYLQKNAGIDRFFGFGTAYIANNFASYYHIYAAEGYDPIYIRRYGELVSSTANGQVPQNVLRSDALFVDADNFYRNRIFDIVGVKYVLDKNDTPKSNWEPEFGKFPQDKYEMVWQNYKWKVYQRKTVLPRAFLADSYEVIPDSTQIVSRLYDPKLALRDTLVLERDPGVSLSPGKIGEATVSSYGPEKVVIQTKADTPRLLFLSDSFYPGWKATVDSKDAPIYRADYVFRAVPVPAGIHTVIFTYDPWSFKFGLAISVFSFLGLIALALFRHQK